MLLLLVFVVARKKERRTQNISTHTYYWPYMPEAPVGWYGYGTGGALLRFTQQLPARQLRKAANNEMMTPRPPAAINNEFIAISMFIGAEREDAWANIEFELA